MNAKQKIIISRRQMAILVITAFTTISVAGGLFFWYIDSALGHGDHRWVQMTKLLVAVATVLCLVLLHRTRSQPRPD